MPTAPSPQSTTTLLYKARHGFENQSRTTHSRAKTFRIGPARNNTRTFGRIAQHREERKSWTAAAPHTTPGIFSTLFSLLHDPTLLPLDRQQHTFFFFFFSLRIQHRKMQAFHWSTPFPTQLHFPLDDDDRRRPSSGSMACSWPRARRLSLLLYPASPQRLLHHLSCIRYTLSRKFSAASERSEDRHYAAAAAAAKQRREISSEPCLRPRLGRPRTSHWDLAPWPCLYFRTTKGAALAYEHADRPAMAPC